jgi:FkbM family methyltransferase
MRVYRRSPLYPWCGRHLARLLLAVTRPGGSVIHEVRGIRYELDLRQVIDSSLYYAGSIEPHAECVMASVVKPGMVVIDVGANIGCHTFPLARLVGAAGRVVAVEPTSDGFAKLRRNLSLNAFSNVKLVRAGLADQDLGPVENHFLSSYRLDGKDEIPTEITRVLTLDTLVNEEGLPRVDFIKIDTDGYEKKIVDGARETLSRYRPVVFFEFGPHNLRGNGAEPESLLETFWSLGYRLRTERGVETPDAASVFRSVQSGPGLINLLATRA